MAEDGNAMGMQGSGSSVDEGVRTVESEVHTHENAVHESAVHQHENEEHTVGRDDVMHGGHYVVVHGGHYVVMHAGHAEGKAHDDVLLMAKGGGSSRASGRCD